MKTLGRLQTAYKREEAFPHCAQEKKDLWKSLIETPLFDSLKKGEFEIVPIESGDILKITSSGTIEKE